ncbi:MAG: DNA/RNA nuclease SfsA [Blautia sp.]|jgi:sugar fermentation stimulation protein A
MKYDNITKGIFLSRPNRFLAHVEVDGEPIVCHVKNTGRLRELLLAGAEVGLVHSDNPARKTAYDLVSVKKDGSWVNIDSMMANQAAEEWLTRGLLFSKAAVIRREVSFGGSRFDFYVEDGERKIFLEVKGVTLIEEDTAKFPDAPTIRGVKHIRELEACIREGYEAYLLFVIQRKGATRFWPNWDTHREFGEALCHAKASGVKLLAYDCFVDMGTVQVDAPVGIFL